MISPLPVPHFRQSREGACLPACTRMVLHYLGMELEEATIGRTLGAKPYGTPSSAILRLNDAGLEVIYQRWSTAEVAVMLQTGHPIIVFVRTIFLGYYHQDFAHAVVIVASDAERHFFVQDPAQPAGPTKVHWDGLLAAWAEFDYYGAVIRRQP